MSIIVTDNRNVWTTADSTTGWTGATLNTATPSPVEGTGCAAIQVSSTTADEYFTTGSSQNVTNKLVYIWTSNRASLDIIANVGTGILLGDGTNRVAFGVAGSDVTPFRHDIGPVGWACGVIDTANLPTYQLTRAGASASLNLSSITQIGSTFVTLAKSVGGLVNCFTDIIRVLDPTANNGAAITISGGTSTTPGTFLQIAQADRSTGSLQAYGVIRELDTGAYGVQGKLRFGDITGSSNSYFLDKNISLIFENRGLAATRSTGASTYGLIIAGTSTNTSSFQLGTKVGTGTTALGTDGCNLTSPAGVGADFDAQTNLYAKHTYIYGSTFNGFTGGIKLRDGQEFINNVVNTSGAIIASGSTMVNCFINNSIATSSLIWDVNFDPSGYLDGCVFQGSGSSHAIQFGPNCPATMSLVGVKYTNYGNAGTPSASLYNNSAKALLINVTGGGSIPTITNGAGASTTVVAGLINISLTGLVSGTAVEVLSTGTTNVLASTSGTSTDNATFTFSLAAGIIVDIAIVNVFYDYILIVAYTIPSQDSSIPISQVFDRNYNNPP